MIRSALVILSVCCVATLLSEVVGLAVLWHRGQLTSETIKDIRDILSGEDADAFSAEDESEKIQASLDDVMQKRAFGILKLSTRENELGVLKAMLETHAAQLIADQEAFEKKKKDFEEELRQTRENETSVAAEEARGILLAMSPEQAVESLMQLDLDANVVLMQAMPEKKIAKILTQFFRSNDPDQSERGFAIFKAISRGEPTISVIDNANSQFAQGIAPTQN